MKEIKENEIFEVNETTIQEIVSKEEYDKLNQKYLLAVSDYQNLKRRTETNNANTYREMKKNLVNQFLPIIDDLDRAANEIKDPSLFMIFRKTMVMLAENQIYQFANEGEVFDADRHNAVLVECDETKEDNTILRVLKHGYILGEQYVIRYADVVVNKLNNN
jgi:molecular chaperone GrpE